MKYSLSLREIRRVKPEGNPEGEARGISRGLRLYFIAFPDSSHNTDILNNKSSIDLPSGFALGISLGLRLYFIVYPSSCHNTDSVQGSTGPGLESWLGLWSVTDHCQAPRGGRWQGQYRSSTWRWKPAGREGFSKGRKRKKQLNCRLHTRILAHFSAKCPL